MSGIAFRGGNAVRQRRAPNDAAARHTREPAPHEAVVPDAEPAARPATATTVRVTVEFVVPDDAIDDEVAPLPQALRWLADEASGPATAMLPVQVTMVARTPDGGRTRAVDLTAQRPPGPTDLRLFPESRTVRRGTTRLDLTRLEFDLLRHLAANPCRVFTRQQLLRAVWGDEVAGQRTVDVHIRRLRAKVGADIPLVATVRGIGYRLAEGAPVSVIGEG